MVASALTFLPLALVGLWRWGVWTGKVLLARTYRPFTDDPPDVSVSVVAPVYRADPDDFIDTVFTWFENDPDEIIAVIDEGDREIIRRFYQLVENYDEFSCIVTPKDGKRPALHDGVRRAEGDIIALVDDDVKWRSDTMVEFCRPFADPTVGAVSPKQIVSDQSTLAQRLYEVQMRLQFAIDYPALSSISRSLSCVSGRTAVYRREAIETVIDDLATETFLGKPVISGDDKFLTRAIQANGWDAVYQSTSVIDIGAAPDARTFINQTVRWTRNTIRSDLMAFWEGWVFRRKWLAYYNVDRFIATFAILLAPVYFTLSLTAGLYLVAVGILVWWLLSRSVKMYPYLTAYTGGFSLVPLYTIGSFLMSPVYLYALFSANAQGWLTRGDDTRFGFPPLRRRLVTSLSVGLVLATLAGYISLLLTVRY
ncbi:glycosyltransferase [Halovivax cerinus]|uniref:Glycosyltransferase n=1 Tax=Halovivax cerinus TaxID=1487865 RepID=A0ABD5NKK4_9EURY|nr:glycosyltransferase [Halovivax cerinus]